MAMAESHAVETGRRIGDLYLGAALLALGHPLAGTTREGGRVLFHFTGPGVDGAVMAYANETLNVNAARYVHALDRLRVVLAHTRS